MNAFAEYEKVSLSQRPSKDPVQDTSGHRPVSVIQAELDAVPFRNVLLGFGIMTGSMVAGFFLIVFSSMTLICSAVGAYLNEVFNGGPHHAVFAGLIVASVIASQLIVKIVFNIFNNCVIPKVNSLTGPFFALGEELQEAQERERNTTSTDITS